MESQDPQVPVDPARVGAFLAALVGPDGRPAAITGLTGHRAAERAIAEYCGRWNAARTASPSPHAAGA